MGFLATGGGFNDGFFSRWWDKKHPSFPSQTCSDNTNWETAAVHMSVAEDAIRKSTDGVNSPLELWGCTNYPRYHAYRFHTYRNFPNKRDPDIAEQTHQSIQEYAEHNSVM